MACRARPIGVRPPDKYDDPLERYMTPHQVRPPFYQIKQPHPAIWQGQYYWPKTPVSGNTSLPSTMVRKVRLIRGRVTFFVFGKACHQKV